MGGGISSTPEIVPTKPQGRPDELLGADLLPLPGHQDDMADRGHPHQAMAPLRRHSKVDGVQLSGFHGSDRVPAEPEASAA